MIDIEESHTSSPGLGRGLVAGLLAHGVRLALVLGHAGVDSPGRVLVNCSSSLLRLQKGSYWTMSGRMGALKTFGRGWVLEEALPSAEMMVTTGRLVILAASECAVC